MAARQLRGVGGKLSSTSSNKRNSCKQPQPPEQQEPLRFATKAIKSIGDDCLIFHCVAIFQDSYKINRNMIVLKCGPTSKSSCNKDPENSTSSTSLTLIDPLILSGAGEKTLLKQGVVENIVRLGSTVGMYDGSQSEDQYYLDKFKACQRWAPGRLASCPKVRVDRILKNKRPDDFFHKDCRCFVLRSTKEPEALLLLQRAHGGNILIAGHCVQHQIDNPYCNPPSLARMRMAGLLKAPVVVSKAWLNANVDPEKGGMEGIQSSLETMTRAKFTRFLSTSGNTILKGEHTKQAVVDAVQKAFVMNNTKPRQRTSHQVAQTTHD